MTKTVGLIGLGPMGGNVARNLLSKQFTVCGFDLKPDCMSALVNKGLSALDSVVEVLFGCRRCDHLPAEFSGCYQRGSGALPKSKARTGSHRMLNPDD